MNTQSQKVLDDNRRILESVAVSIVEACIRRRPVPVADLALEAGVRSERLFYVLAVNKCGPRLFLLKERRTNLLMVLPYKDNAIKMLRHLTPAGEEELQRRVCMIESEIADALKALPVVEFDEKGRLVWPSDA